MDVKKPTTFEQQIDKLKNRDCIIEDEKKALTVLRRVNYYRLTAYFLPFTDNDGNYISGTSFNRVLRIYEFDKKLRCLIFPIVEELEILLRTELSYMHSHKYGELGYRSAENFNSHHNHDDFFKTINSCIEHNKNQLFVKHHIEKYDSKFPLWVIIELFSFGNVSRFYADMIRQDKKQFANKIFHISDKILESWLYCLTRLRNYCAHYSRLYFNQFSAIPQTPKNSTYEYKSNVFDYILLLKNLSLDKENWNNNFLIQLESLIEEYSDSISFSHIGFPNDWIQHLKK